MKKNSDNLRIIYKEKFNCEENCCKFEINKNLYFIPISQLNFSAGIFNAIEEKNRNCENISKESWKY